MGFQAIDPANYSYEQQIRLFRQAEFIVAPHGAALTNLLYSSAGVKVIELFADCYINLGLQRLANLKNARYGYLVNESVGSAAGSDEHEFSYTIDIASLVKLIEDLES